MEELEQRQHLAATLLSAYWPLQPGSEWVFNEVNDGKNRTDTLRILSGTVPVHGERAFQVVEDAGEGPSTSLQNISASGKIQIHRSYGDDGRMTFNPAFAYPKLAKVGQRSVMDGAVDLVIDGVHLKGHYHVDAQVAKTEQVRVAAGVFSTVKIQTTASMVFRYSAPGRKISLRMSSSDSLWLAKGVGKVKEIVRNHSETNINGKRKVDDGVCKDALRSYAPGT